MMQIIKSTFCSSETPEYKVIATHNRYEERRYSSCVMVSTRSTPDPMGAAEDRETGGSKKSDDDTACCKLFNYIQGQNEGNHVINMSFPVIEQYTSSHEGDTKHSLSFFIPKEFEEKTPLPTDPANSIQHCPAITIYAMKFGGFANDEKCIKEKKKFAAILESEGVKFKSDAFFCAYYNTPFKLVNRHNEIWLVKAVQETDVDTIN